MNISTEQLSDHTWLKIGGPAEMAIPETKAEFVEILTECHETNRDYRILGGGSNLLVSDAGVDELVIKSTNACTEFEVDGTHVTAGASIMLPQFINQYVAHGLGGYEYLYSVPGTIGGAIYMNAGRGRSHGLTISDYLSALEVFVDGDVRTISVDELEFEHRYSTFQEHDDWVILSAEFELPEQSIEQGRKNIKKRMQKVGQRERGQPNAGSVYKSGSRLPLHKIPPNGLSIGDARFVSGNRISHTGAASYSDVRRLVYLGKMLNRFRPPFKSSVVEWEIWE